MNATHYPRYSQDLVAIVTRSDGSSLTGSTANLSTEGAYLVVDQRLKKGDHCILELQLNSDSGESSYKIRADVIDCSQLSDTPGFSVGLKFTDSPDHYLSLIEQLHISD